MKSKRLALLCTCEHGGNSVPKNLKPLFSDAKQILESHRGWDMGALHIARAVSRRLKAPLIFSKTSRLVVDLNRSQSNPKLFSKFTQTLSRTDQEWLLERYYFPYRRKVLERLNHMLVTNSAALHLSFHSFTPMLNGVIRNCEFGLLYDPSRALEKKITHGLKSTLMEDLPSLRTRMNYPYKGIADGLTTNLRKKFGASRYAGIEIEINQSLLASATQDTSENLANVQRITATIVRGLNELLVP
jgi:predicted N-formylglutamate amidohydrolase